MSPPWTAGDVAGDGQTQPDPFAVLVAALVQAGEGLEGVLVVLGAMPGPSSSMTTSTPPDGAGRAAMSTRSPWTAAFITRLESARRKAIGADVT
jgi:hypothetical protein